MSIIYNKNTNIVIASVGQSKSAGRSMYRRLILFYGVKGEGMSAGRYDSTHATAGKLTTWFDVDLKEARRK